MFRPPRRLPARLRYAVESQEGEGSEVEAGAQGRVGFPAREPAPRGACGLGAWDRPGSQRGGCALGVKHLGQDSLGRGAGDLDTGRGDGRLGA